MTTNQKINTFLNQDTSKDVPENEFIPNATRVQDYLHFWNQDGSFNLNLYLRICTIKNQQK